MKLRHLTLALVTIALSSPAFATVKVYDATPPGGTAGDTFLYTTTLCPPIDPTPGVLQGSYTLTDTSTGSVTMDSIVIANTGLADIPDLTAVFGPGSFVFLTLNGTDTTTTIPVGTGSTAPGGTVAWGVISGWQATGFAFCIASPQTICTGGSMVPHGITVATPPPNSATYDLGTWSFDAEGDITATANYIYGTFNGGTSNRQRILRGSYVGASVPALPLVGAGALALALAIAGVRSVARKR